MLFCGGLLGLLRFLGFALVFGELCWFFRVPSVGCVYAFCILFLCCFLCL